MDATKYHSLLIVFLIAVLCTSLVNVQAAYADDETPTEPPAPTQVGTEPPTEPAVAETALPTEPAVVETELARETPVAETPIPEQSSAVPEEATAPPVAEAPTQTSEEMAATPVVETLSQVPENTDVIVLDESGEPLPLVAQEAAEIIEMNDPMWCPEGVLPGGTGCSDPYPNIAGLLKNMRENPSFYNEAGVIYFTSSSSSLVLSEQPGSLGAAYDTLKNFDLTLQGGWSGSTDSPSLSGQTDFANNRISIGTATNPWVGNIILNDLAFSGGNTMLVSVYTTVGDITLNNVDVTGQTAAFPAALDSDSGDITVQNSTFSGTSGRQSRGFYATTGGSISIRDTSFTEAGTRNTTRYDGASLNAPVVTLTNVTATDNDGSGVFVTGARLIIIGGTFTNNQEYGIEVGNPASTTIYIQSDPTCTGNGIACYNDTTISDNTGPVITPIVNSVQEVKGWYGSDVSVSWSVTDAESGILSSNCPPVTLTIETTGTTLTCSATNNAGLSNSVSVTIRIDKSAPVITSSVTGAMEVDGWYSGDVSVSWSVTDAESGILSSNCPPITLTTETTGTTLTCSAMNNAGLSNSASITIRIDKSGPVLNSSDITTEATGPAGAVVSYSVSAIDAVDGPVPASCSPVSGSTFPMGSTSVNCSASDSRGNTNGTLFLVTVTDSTAPSIEPLADITASTDRKSGKFVFYPSPNTSDVVDGAGVATCSPASGSLFPVGETQVTCTATDAHGNSATSTFIIRIDYEKVLSPMPTDDPASPVIVIPATGGELIDLDCDSAFWAFGVRLSFINLCDQQTTIHEVGSGNLPAELPDGFSLVVGLSVDVLNNGKLIQELPKDSSLQMSFPMAGGANNHFAVFYWSGGEWIKISEQNGNDQLPQILDVTINKPGIYVLGKK